MTPSDREIEEEAFKRAIQKYSETSEFEHRHGNLAEDRFLNIRESHWETEKSMREVQTRISVNRIEFEEGDFVCDKFDSEGRFISTLKVKITRSTKNTGTDVYPYGADDLYSYSWRNLPGYPTNSGCNTDRKLSQLQDDTFVKGLSREMYELVNEHSNTGTWLGTFRSLKRKGDDTVKSCIIL